MTPVNMVCRDFMGYMIPSLRQIPACRPVHVTRLLQRCIMKELDEQREVTEREPWLTCSGR